MDQRTLVNVWQDTTLGNCDMTEELVQFFIVADGELEMARNDTGLLVVTSGVASQFEDFSREILKNCREVDGSTWRTSELRWKTRELDEHTSTNTLSIVALSQQTVDTADRESKTCF